MRTCAGILMLVTSATAGPISAQTPRAVVNTGQDPVAAAASAGSPWIGSQVFYNVGGTDKVADNLLVAATLLYEIETGTRWVRLPVMGNIGNLFASADTSAAAEDQLAQKAQQLLLGASGFSVGVYPYVPLVRWGHGNIVLHLAAAFKVNAFADTANATKYLPVGRFLGGIEASIGNQTKPRSAATISVTPTYTLFGSSAHQQILGYQRDSYTGFETTLVLPLGRGFGFLFESIAAKDVKPALRAAILLAKEI
jgi:hypothetical protein